MPHLFQKSLRFGRALYRRADRRVNQRTLDAVIVFVLSAMLLAGCATSSSRLWEHSERPQISIAGAEVKDVRSIAMGSARSKGWRIVETADERLILERRMDVDSPQAVAAGVNGPAPTIRVTTYFAQHSDSVNVGLDAQLVGTTGAKGAPQTTDYTETYRNALERSLESLRGTYASHRHRVMSSTPPLNEPGELAETMDDDAAAQDEASSGSAPNSAPSTTASSVAVTLPSGEQAWRSESESAEIPAWETSAQGGSPPQPGTSTEGTSATPMTPELAPVDRKDNMLVLNDNTATGTWAYYAEQYARLRGCNLGDRGAELQQKTAEYEVHQVSCVNGQSFQLRCSDGVCRGLN